MPALADRVRQAKAAPRFYTVGVPLFCALYVALLAAVGGLWAAHVIAVVAILFLSLWSDRTRNWTRVVFPFLLYGVVYDSMRWYADYIRSPIIHIHEPYDFDKRFFGIHTVDGVLTPNEWWQRHTQPVLDFVCGLSYTPFFFIGESAILAVYLFVTGEERRAVRFAWVFTLANFVGFSLYYIYPAAPPWYVADHGFVADLSVHASAAGAARFDALVGMPVMASFYGKSADVFGAIPSLHVVYPFLALAYGWHLPRFRPVAIAYWLLVCFSAVYLNHHYLLDIFAGLSIACAVMALTRIGFGALEPAAGLEPVTEPARPVA